MKTLAAPVVFAGLLGFAGAAHCADVIVGPGQTISNGVQLALPGDRVLVLPGTYVETVDFGFKKIQIIGVGGAEVTTIDGGGTTFPVVTSFIDGTSAERVIEGFTIRNGANCVQTALGSGLTISRCVLRDAIQSGADTGYGLRTSSAGPGFGVPEVKVVESVIESNPAGGVWGDVSMLRCTVAHNQGRGVEGKTLEITECSILDNTSPLEGAGIYAFAISEPLSVYVNRTTIAGNTTTGTGASGIAVGSLAVFASVGLTSCSIIGNHSACGPGASLTRVDHTGIFSISIVCSNVIFAGNTSSNPTCGAGVELNLFPLTTASAILERCTVVGNDGAGFRNTNANTNRIVRHSIFWNQVNPLPANAQVTDSDIQFGFPGAGNFNADPLFVDLANLDLHLTPGSPCVDKFAGAPSADFEGDLPAGNYDCGADEYRPRLYYTGSAAPGGSLGFGIVGGSSAAPTLYFVSLERLEPGIATPFGSFGLALPVILGFPIDFGSLSPSGSLTFQTPVPLTIPSGLALHTQAFVGGPGAALTNVATLVFE